MSRKGLMAAAAVIVIGGVALVAIGSGRFLTSPHPVTTNQ